MVSLPSPATQVVEIDKRRKSQHTIEKAKANHLTRQLQMRLQYARLKVEHGWQKQNLNEVENLYFHNSHLRGGLKSCSSNSTQPIMTTLPLLASSSSLHPTPTQQLQNTGSIQNHSFHNIPTPNTAVADLEQPSQDIIQALQAAVARATASAATPDAPNVAYLPDDSILVDNSATPIVPSLRPEGLPHIPPVVVQVPTPTTPTIPAPTTTRSFPLLSPQSPTPSTHPPPSSTSNHYPSLKLPRTRNNKHPAGPKGAHQNLTAKDMLDFASTSTSTLTYDSFWSSHSASAPSSRSPRPVLTSNGVTGLAPAFQNSTLFTNGFAGIDLNQFVNASFAPTSTTMTSTVEHPRSLAP